MSFRTEYNFTLPKGYVDEEGNIHRDGVMRFATAADEIIPRKDPHVQQNPSYLMIVLLSRVITKLDSLKTIDEKVIENLYASGLYFLQNIYKRINETNDLIMNCRYPICGNEFKMPIEFNK